MTVANAPILNSIKKYNPVLKFNQEMIILSW